MIDGAGFQALRPDVRSRLDFGHIQLIEQRLLHEHHADVRTVELVCGAGEEVTVERLDINLEMRRVMHGVDKNECADRSGCGNDLSKVAYRAERIRRGADREQAAASRNDLVNRIQLQHSGAWVHPNTAQNNTS